MPKGQRREQGIGYSENLKETRGKLFSMNNNFMATVDWGLNMCKAM